MTPHSEHAVENLSADECWKLLTAAPLGRLATAVADPATGQLSLDVFPVNFLVHEGAIFFRTGPGAKFVDITANERVAFEADGLAVDGQSEALNWSVVVHGSAHRLMLDRDIEQSGVLQLDATHPTDKWNYVRITVDSITGIRFRR
jgi:nitroimidazol reductase NimA-like FMN-containing flavoprotein (pyridoxamine 5'-phosphate oxidase superfamily)